MIIRGDLRGLREETEAALQAAPGYWLAWYSVKSIALALSFGVIGYMIGRERGRNRR